MGLPSCKLDDAWYRYGPRRSDDRKHAQRALCAGRRGRSLCLGLFVAASGAAADTTRIAFFNTSLERDGPGLLSRDIANGAEDVAAVAAVIARIAPDVVVLEGIDYDFEGRALAGLREAIAAEGHEFTYEFSAPPNTGVPLDLDLNGDRRGGGPEDAQSYGAFAGQGGLALLAMGAITLAKDHSEALWAEVGALGPPDDFYPEGALAQLRLSSVAHWELDVALAGTSLRLMTWAGSAPVFDGPEDRNGRRNHDELVFWRDRIEAMPAERPFVLLGNANLDPLDGDGRTDAMKTLLAHPRLQDVEPGSRGGSAAADAEHAGDPRLDTVDWPGGAPGNLRVSYVLPWAEAEVSAAGVFWPAIGEPGSDLLGPEGNAAGPHRLVWVDLILDR